MNYSEIQAMASAGIDFFSDGDGEFVIIISGGGVKIVNGKEVTVQEQRGMVKGLVRDVQDREINGESILVGDKRGIFNAAQEITKGMRIIVDDEYYTVTNARPIKPTGTVVAYRPILRRIAVSG